MIRLLVDLLTECGWLERAGIDSRWAFRLEKVPRVEAPAEEESADGEIRFFRRCIAWVPEYLRGREPPIDFEADSIGAWEEFLGCEEFQACRTALLDMMPSGNGSSMRLLDLCYGPGLGVEIMMERRPGARISAIDFTDVFAATARRRAERACARNLEAGIPASTVDWFGPSDWRGFGALLPFASGSFDAVLFSCGDPYIPPGKRESVYLDLRRILASGGTLGILTRGYPDPEHRHVSLFWLRVTALIHDFAESVCAGWQGFADVDESLRMFTGMGFSGAGTPPGKMNYLGASLWLLRKE
jgi:SAM-dependent methyltransferase